MPLTNSIKPLLDLPAWEWTRFAPFTFDGSRSIVTPSDGSSRFAYGLGLSGTPENAVRYDTYTDTWQTLASSPINATSGMAAAYRNQLGYAFRPITAGGSTVTGALLQGDRLKGATIEVIEGTGAGQVRTISSVADTVIAERGVNTTITQTIGSAGWLRDTNKAWSVNQWVGYQMRIVLNSGSTVVMRKILYNDSNTLYFYDPAWSSHSPYEWGGFINQTLGATAGSAATYVIESSVATLDSAWTTAPDNTSIIMCRTGALVSVAGIAATPFFYNKYYDVISDVWYMQSATAGPYPSAQNEMQVQSTESWGSPFATGTATASSTTTSLAAGGSPGWETNRWANYAVRITSGAGVGQYRTIASSTSSSLVPLSPFTISPDGTSTFEIIGDRDKLWIQTNNNARLYQFSFRAQQWYHGRLYDYGVVRSLSAVKGTSDNPLEAFPISSISRSGTTATVLTSINHNLKTGDVVTISGATGADASLFNITTTSGITVSSLTSFSYVMSGTPVGATATPNSMSATVLVDASKNWATNELVGKTLQWSAASGATEGLNGLAVITANTSNTITVATAGTTPVNGQKYAITDGPAFGFDNFTGNSSTNGTGLATSGSTTTLVDSTKTWAVNEHANKLLFISAGVGNGQLLTITSNTSTTLSFGTATAPAVNSRYSILDINTRGGGSGLQWAAYPSVAHKGRYLFSFRGGTTPFVNRYDIATQQWSSLAVQNLDSLSSGSLFAYDGVDKIYIQVNTTNRILVMDVDTYKTDLYGQAPYTVASAAPNDKMFIVTNPDGLKYLYLPRGGGNEMWRTLLFL